MVTGKTLHRVGHLVALAVLALAVLVGGAEAYERPFILQGTVGAVDTTSRTVTIQPSAEYAGGSWTGATHRPLSGVAPDGADLAALPPGTLVEAASLGSPGGRWTMLAPLASSSPSRPATTRAMAVYGDPAFLVSPLPGEVQFGYTTSGLCGGPGTAGNATEASVTLSAERGGVVDVRTLDLMAGGEGTATLNGTVLRVRFHGGDAQAGPGCPAAEGRQPIADFTIVLEGGPPSVPSSPPATETPGFPALSGLAALAAAAALATCRR